MQPLPLTPDVETGLVEVRHRRLLQALPHDLLHGLQHLGRLLQRPIQRGRTRSGAEQVREQFGSAFVRQQLVVSQVEPECLEPRSILQRLGGRVGGPR